MSVELLFILLILGVIAYVIMKGSKLARSITGYIILYCDARLLDDRLFNGGVSDFIRNAIQAVINAFQGIFNPNDIGALVISALIVAALIWLLLKGHGLRDLIAFALAYVVLRFIEVGLFGNGFSSLMHDIFLNISKAFANGAASI